MIFENFEIALVLLGQFQFFQKCTRAICSPNHAITSSNQVPFQENLSNRFWGNFKSVDFKSKNASFTFFCAEQEFFQKKGLCHFLVLVNPLSASVAFIFAQQINWLVSIWGATPAFNGLSPTYMQRIRKKQWANPGKKVLQTDGRPDGLRWSHRALQLGRGSNKKY